MGRREVHICDVCKRDLPFDGMFPMFQGAEVKIQLYKSRWGDLDWLVGWKGELCEECAAIVNRTAETFRREMEQRQREAQPGFNTSEIETEGDPPESSADAKTPVARKRKASGRRAR